MAAAASPNGGVLALPSCPPIGCQRARWRHGNFRPGRKCAPRWRRTRSGERPPPRCRRGAAGWRSRGGQHRGTAGWRRAVLRSFCCEPASRPWCGRRCSRTAFDSNAGAAYEVLGCGGRRRAAGVDGRLYSELLRRICQRGAAPAEAAAELLRRVRCRDHEAVPFDVFRYGVLTCCVLLEFAAKADALFAVLGAGDSADTRLCQAVLRALEDALGAGHGSRPGRYLEAGSRLGPDRLALAMDQALQERKLGSSMSREEFLKKATALFIAKARLRFPIDYPYSPPAFRFLTKMWHPNIYETGDVCISILHPPVDDPQSGELPSERWNPTQNVRTILLSVISLLNEPNTFSPANVDASVMYRKWKESKGKDREYTDIIRKQVLGTKVDAERDGVKVPTTLAEYCVKTKTPAPDEGSDLFYDDYYEDDEMEEEAESCYGDEDDSGNEES
uniref:Cell division cycle 34, ubiqiutin conjugating enzyme n=3 Tax=Passeriformes TaxID=9126 RepID=A0A8C3D5K3_CORMO